MTKRLAIIDNATNLVVNCTQVADEWTGASDQWQPPKDHTARESDAPMGATYNLADDTYTVPEKPPQVEPTLDEIYDQLIQSQRLVKALVLALNDGTFTPGNNLTNAELKAIIKAKL